jgi:hypothetical protein
MTRDQEDSTASRGASEMSSIQHPEASHPPAFGKRAEHCAKVLSTVGKEQCRDIFKHHPAGLYLVDDADGLEEQTGLFSGEAGRPGAPASRCRDVLTGEACGDAINRRKVRRAAITDVRKLRGMGKSVTKHSPVSLVDLDLPRGAESAALEAADAGEEGAERRPCVFDFAVMAHSNFPV